MLAWQMKEMGVGSIHMNVRPIDGDWGTEWPKTIKLTTDKTLNKLKVERDHEIGYKILSHPNYEQGTTLFCLKKCHKIKPCDCDKPNDGDGQPPRKKVRDDATDTLFARLNALAGEPVFDRPCDHFLNGKCRNYKIGVRCRLGHPNPAPPIKTVPCTLINGIKRCRNGPKCLYKHPWE